MSSPGPVTADILRWTGSGLELLDHCDPTASAITAADSWLTSEGRTLGLDLHRQRFLEAAPGAAAFWEAAVAAIPRTGDWFPRVEAHDDGRLLFRLRSAPQRTRSVVLTSHRGDDPRTQPEVKGPDLEVMRRLRAAAQKEGADETIITTPEGYVVEGAYSAIAWWRGSILCTPPAEFARIDSVTARSLVTLATALGVDTHEEAVTPGELDGTEIWVLNALQGPRIVTRWIDGPETAELPGRLATWRSRLDRLARPLP